MNPMQDDVCGNFVNKAGDIQISLVVLPKLSKFLGSYKMHSQIVELANQLVRNVNDVNAYLLSNDLPQPSFDVDGPLELGTQSAPDVEAARISAIEATMELQDLLLGPTMLLRPIVR